MKNLKKTSNSKLIVFGIALILVMEAALCDFTFDAFVIQSENHLRLPKCTSSTEGDTIAENMREANPTRYQPYQITLLLFKPETLAELPNCYQNGVSDPPTGRNLVIDLPGTWTVKPEVEQNLAPNLDQGFSEIEKIANSGTISESQIAEDVANAGETTQTVQGNALIILSGGLNQLDPRFYYFHHFGGYRGLCDPTCATCSGINVNQCNTCSATSSLAGLDVDPLLAGRCFYPDGRVKNDRRPVSCESICTGNCKSCDSASPTKCFSCMDGFEVVTRDTNGVGECVESTSGGACHETCETCSGPNADDCLTCKNISPKGQLTLTNRKECRCPPGQYYVSATKSCSQCHSDCSSCTGTGSDQCLICSDPKSIVRTVPGTVPAVRTLLTRIKLSVRIGWRSSKSFLQAPPPPPP